MKKTLARNIILFGILHFSSFLHAAENENMMRMFKNCGLGIVAGAALGTVIMATQDKPNEHGQDVAKGASLGLYGGLIYTYYQFTTPPASRIGAEVSAEAKTLTSPVFALGRDQVQLGIISRF